MISLKKRQSGFTIVELLIVIVVIGILATLVIVTFSGIQQKARDSQRQTDINAVDSHLEAYYAEHGVYPSIGQLNDSSWRTTNMKGLDAEALKDPKGSATTVAGTASSTTYGYAAKAGASACPDPTTLTDLSTCDSFTLTAKLESGSDYTKQSN